MRKHWKKLAFILFVLAFAIFVVVPLLKPDNPPLQKPKTRQIYAPYPNTSDPPVLEFHWEGELGPDDIVRTTPYGVWEGWFDSGYEPAVEMQFYTRTGEKPILAVAPGTVILVEPKYKSLTIAYGTHYGVTYHHIEKIPSNINPGDTIKAGDILGYTETMFREDDRVTEAWWEIELNYKKGDVFRTLPPYKYFSKESQAKLDFIIENATQGYPQTGEYDIAWTVREGCSWIKYLDEPEWWSNGIRVGYEAEGDTEKEFLDRMGLGWTSGDRYGRVLGPTDNCR